MTCNETKKNKGLEMREGVMGKIV